MRSTNSGQNIWFLTAHHDSERIGRDKTCLTGHRQILPGCLLFISRLLTLIEKITLAQSDNVLQISLHRQNNESIEFLRSATKDSCFYQRPVLLNPLRLHPGN